MDKVTRPRRLADHPFDGRLAPIEALLLHAASEAKLLTLLDERRGAHSNGLQAVAVGYGFGSREELAAETPAFHFETVADLHRAFLAA